MKHIAMLAIGSLAGAFLPPALAQDNDAEKLFRGMEKKLLAAKAFEVKFDYQLEKRKAKGELLVTICRLDNLSPRIRYNIHDLGHLEQFYTLKKKLKALGRHDLYIGYGRALTGDVWYKDIYRIEYRVRF